MIRPMQFLDYEFATSGQLAGMITAPQLIDVVLVDSGDEKAKVVAKLVGWTLDNQQVYMRPDGYLAFARDPWVPLDASTA